MLGYHYHPISSINAPCAKWADISSPDSQLHHRGLLAVCPFRLNGNSILETSLHRRKSDYGEGTLYWVLVSQKGQQKTLSYAPSLKVQSRCSGKKGVFFFEAYLAYWVGPEKGRFAYHLSKRLVTTTRGWLENQLMYPLPLGNCTIDVFCSWIFSSKFCSNHFQGRPKGKWFKTSSTKKLVQMVPHKRMCRQLSTS